MDTGSQPHYTKIVEADLIVSSDPSTVTVINNFDYSRPQVAYEVDFVNGPSTATNTEYAAGLIRTDGKLMTLAMDYLAFTGTGAVMTIQSSKLSLPAHMVYSPMTFILASDGSCIQGLMTMSVDGLFSFYRSTSNDVFEDGVAYYSPPTVFTYQISG